MKTSFQFIILTSFLIYFFPLVYAANLEKRTINASNVNLKLKIKARPEKIWEVLTDFDSYCKWNPWVRSARLYQKRGIKKFEVTGPVQVGHRANTFTLVDGKLMEVDTKVIKIVPARQFCWKDHTFLTRVFSGGHRCRNITQGPKGPTYSQKFIMDQGMFRSMGYKMYKGQMKEGMHAEMKALIYRANCLSNLRGRNPKTCDRKSKEFLFSKENPIKLYKKRRKEKVFLPTNQYTKRNYDPHDCLKLRN